MASFFVLMYTYICFCCINVFWLIVFSVSVHWHCGRVVPAGCFVVALMFVDCCFNVSDYLFVCGCCVAVLSFLFLLNCSFGVPFFL